ncbi:ABC transporter ATP-binding protein [Legionella spiritensis]|uniref:Spermidine/putrescine transport system ATP-binding protein PotA n=1 Tax=Legionella spiritensis TaxID=452 RepID=A0A0W0Z603_LEGSP|nr:ATP-binding cassette domain-containing protein [Legionella spiritensis]KTD64334.1 spermidine/putrescine transport system ATP-binding protein PotA [Legionella spiritensis]SNV46521.1 spermidine/putrescine transport system ATP-binding protein PotA [Legionella spiritensis]VEG91101.1 spermidine/putrescine transport system ATP-binding protein PotA [Legionella spiritensis]
MITLKNVSKSFDEKETYSVKNISLSILDGETLVLLGSSGSGKSTLLNLINRAFKPTSGSIEIDDKPIEDYPKVQLRRSMGFVFQHTGLFPHMTVAKNIAIIMRLMKIPKEQRVQRVYELLQLVNLEPEKYYDRYPDELSGGEQQRVGVARALATNPDYILMDEPFAALDAITRETLQNEIIDLKKKLNKTIIFVTHDINEAFRLADRIAIMHEGRLEQIGAKEDVLQHPATDFVGQLLNNKTSN